MSENNEVAPEQPSGISRRTVTKAMAWAVPAIAVAAPVPAFAASPGFVNLTGDGCKLPGNSNDQYKGNAFRASIENTYNVPVTITINTVTLNGSSLGNVTVVNLNGCSELGSSFPMIANSSYPNVAIVTTNAGNSQNGLLAVSYTISGGPGGTEEATASVQSVPPIQGGSCTAFTNAEAACINSL